MKQILIFEKETGFDLKLYESSDEVWIKQKDGSFACKKTRTGDVTQHNPGTPGYSREAFLQHLEAKRIFNPENPLTEAEVFRKPKQLKRSEIRKMLLSAWRNGFETSEGGDPILISQEVDRIIETFLKNKSE